MPARVCRVGRSVSGWPVASATTPTAASCTDTLMFCAFFGVRFRFSDRLFFSCCRELFVYWVYYSVHGISLCPAFSFILDASCLIIFVLGPKFLALVLDIVVWCAWVCTQLFSPSRRVVYALNVDVKGMKLRASVCFAVCEPTRLILCLAPLRRVFSGCFLTRGGPVFRLVHSVGFRQQFLPLLLFSLRSCSVTALRGFVVFQD